MIDVTDANFETEVVQRSHRIPVVIDFWAEWCPPCRQLKPILEKLSAEQSGKWFLAKANTEDVPHVASQFGVQSIPAVFAMRDGKVIDAFAGALPENQVRLWLEGILPSSAETLLQSVQGMLPHDPAAAETTLRQAIAEDPSLATAHIQLAELLVSQQRIDDAEEIISELERRGFLEPEGERVKAAIHRSRQGVATGGIAACRAVVTQRPQDGTAQLKLAEALAGSGNSNDYEEALQICLDLVRRDRSQFGESARQIMVDIFRLLPPDAELTSEYRRKLSAALF